MYLQITFYSLLYCRLVRVLHRVTGQLKEGTVGGALQYVYNFQSRTFFEYSLVYLLACLEILIMFVF